jgi:hypothetical protein
MSVLDVFGEAWENGPSQVSIESSMFPLLLLFEVLIKTPVRFEE